MCGEPGHRQYACPSRTSTFKSDVLCKICGDGGHPTIDCPVKGTTGKKMDDEYQNFLAELGGSVPESSTKQSTMLALGSGTSNSESNPPWANNNRNAVSTSHAGLGATVFKPTKEIDDTNLYIGYLPPTLDDDGLISLFSPFGDIVMAKGYQGQGYWTEQRLWFCEDLVKEVQCALYLTLLEFTSNVEDESDLESLIEQQFEALQKAFKIPYKASEARLMVSKKLLTLFRARKLGLLILDDVFDANTVS
ncbi:hypothetical protein CMV_015976 [Castanea mollissima]|uniref:CCHC-type domain-containing protein n=1 Tax=Castanea mollissima TaxID=60419 RepID=A0A8J4VSI1_9ROSI|nr:hypothetical protein CMV_015976 [Castanea mollissima]